MHPLGCIGPQSFDLALDVDHLARPEADARGDAGGPAEGEVAELDHREAVHLADDLALVSMAMVPCA